MTNVFGLYSSSLCNAYFCHESAILIKVKLKSQLCFLVPLCCYILILHHLSCHSCLITWLTPMFIPHLSGTFPYHQFLIVDTCRVASHNFQVQGINSLCRLYYCIEMVFQKNDCSVALGGKNEKILYLIYLLKSSLDGFISELVYQIKWPVIPIAYSSKNCCLFHFCWNQSCHQITLLTHSLCNSVYILLLSCSVQIVKKCTQPVIQFISIK